MGSTDREVWVCVHTSASASSKKGGDPVTGHNVDEPRGPYVKWDQLVTKGHTVCDVMYVSFPEESGS